MANERLCKKVKKHIWDPTSREMELGLKKGLGTSCVGEVSLLFQISVLSICKAEIRLFP